MKARDYIKKAEKIALNIEEKVESIQESLSELSEVKGEVLCKEESFQHEVEQLEVQSKIINRVSEKLEAITN